MKLYLCIIAFLAAPLLSRAQAGSPLNFGPWSALNIASDVHSSDLGCYASSQVTAAPQNLQITMIGGTFSCGQTSSQSGTFSTTQSYLSGSVVMTTQTFAPTAGHNIVIEVKAKLGRGWPAVWLLGTNCNPVNLGTWDNTGTCSWSSDAASSAEVDIAEVNPSAGYLSIGHNKFVNGASNSCSQSVTDVTQNVHVYHMDWSTSAIGMAVDGVAASCGYTSGIPTHPMFLIIEDRQQTGAVDASFATQPITSVQYVQVCDAGNGTACSTPGSNGGNTIFFDDFSGYGQKSAPGATLFAMQEKEKTDRAKRTKMLPHFEEAHGKVREDKK